jgi:hypothetical protein
LHSAQRNKDGPVQSGRDKKWDRVDAGDEAGLNEFHSCLTRQKLQDEKRGQQAGDGCPSTVASFSE